MPYRTEGVDQEISNKGSGIGWKYVTCLTNLAKVLDALPGNPYYPRIQVLDKTKFNLKCVLLVDVEESEFVRLPWGLTHIPSGYIILGDEVRETNIISFNVTNYYNNLGIRNYSLTSAELAWLAEQYKTNQISAQVLALYLTFSSPRGPQDTPNQLRSLIHSFLTPRNQAQQGFSPEDSESNRKISWQNFALVVKLAMLPPLPWLSDNMGLDPKFTDLQFAGFPVAPPAEATSFAKKSPGIKAVVDNLLNVARKRRTDSDAYPRFAEHANSSDTIDPLMTNSQAEITSRRLSSNAPSGRAYSRETLSIMDSLEFAEGRGVFDTAVMFSLYDVSAAGVASGFEFDDLQKDAANFDPELLRLASVATANRYGSDFRTDASFGQQVTSPRTEEPTPGVQIVSWDWVSRVSKLFKVAADVIEGSVP